MIKIPHPSKFLSLKHDMESCHIDNLHETKFIFKNHSLSLNQETRNLCKKYARQAFNSGIYSMELRKKLKKLGVIKIKESYGN